MLDTISQHTPDTLSSYITGELVDSLSRDSAVSAPYSDPNSLMYKNPFWESGQAAVEKSFFIDGFAGKELPITEFTHIFFLLFTVCLFIFVFFVKNNYYPLSDNFLQIFSFKNKRNVGSKEQITTTEVWGESFLIFQSSLIATILIFSYFYNDFLSALEFSKQSLAFLLVFLAISIYLGLKYLIYSITDFILFTSETKYWIEKYFWSIELLGVFIFLPAVVYIFIPEYREIAFYTIIILFFINKLVIFRNLLNIFSKNQIGIFYYIVYLCGVEIAPYFFIYKGAILLIK